MGTWKFLKNTKGIGMVEVMMGVAISGGLALTVAKLMENSSQNIKTSEAKSENINLKGIIQNILSNQTACNYTFSPLITQANLTSLSANPANSVAVPAIKDKTNTIKYTTASDNILPLTITSMSLKNYSAGAGTGDLEINSTYRKSSSMVMEMKPIRIPINFNINNTVPATPVLVSCSVMAVGGEWMLAGNAGTVDGTDYIGTSDNVPLNFKVNSQKAGRVDSTSATSLGYQAANVATGLNNSAFGFNALRNTTTGYINTAIGSRTLFTNTTGYQNTAIGVDSMYSNTTGMSNTAVGGNSMRNNTTGQSNVAVGSAALLNNTTGQYNIALGTAMMMNTAGNYNVGIGQVALQQNTTGSSNIAIGWSALWGNTIGTHNVGIGNSAAQNISTGGSNTAVGASALTYISTGSNNIGLGYAGAYGVRTGQHNIGIGSNTLGQFPDGSNNIAIGQNALNGGAGPHAVTNSTENTAVGAWGLYNSSEGSFNVALGTNAGAYNKSGSYNTFIGYRSGAFGANMSGSRNVFIGAYAGNASDNTNTAGVATANDKLYINNGTSNIPLIEGDFSSTGRYLQVNSKLHVTGNLTYGGSFSSTSDERLKENIKPLKNSVANLSKIQGVSYQLKDRKDKDAKEVGVIAQNVQKVYPELVTKFTHTDGKEYKAVNYIGLIAPLIEAVKDLYHKLLGLDETYEKQDKQIKNLKAENEQLKADLKRQQESFDARMKKLESRMDKQEGLKERTRKNTEEK